MYEIWQSHLSGEVCQSVVVGGEKIMVQNEARYPPPPAKRRLERFCQIQIIVPLHIQIRVSNEIAFIASLHMFFANGEQVDGFIISSTTIPPIHSDDELNAMNEKKNIIKAKFILMVLAFMISLRWARCEMSFWFRLTTRRTGGWQWFWIIFREHWLLNLPRIKRAEGGGVPLYFWKPFYRFFF